MSGSTEPVTKSTSSAIGASQSGSTRRELRVGADAPADAAERDHPHHPLAGLEAVPAGDHHAGEVPAEHERRLEVGHAPAGQAGARGEVGGVDRGGVDADEHLARPGLRIRPLRLAQHLRAAELRYLSDPHG